MKIFIAGEDRDSSYFIRDALLPSGYDIQIVNLENLNHSLIKTSNLSLLILNFSQISASRFMGMGKKLDGIQQFKSPVIAFADGSSYQQLLESLPLPEGQIFELPFSRSEVHHIINELIKDNNNRQVQESRKTSGAKDKLRLDTLVKMLDRITSQDYQLSDIIPELLNQIPKQSLIPYVLLFENIHQQDFILKYHNSDIWIKNDLILNLSKIVPAEEYGLQPYILQNLTSTDPGTEYLQSIFGIKVKSAAIFPVIPNQSIHFVLLVLHTEYPKFSTSSIQYLKYIQYLLKFIFLQQMSPPLHTQEYVENISIKFFKSIVDQLNFGIIILDKKLDIKYINHEGEKLLKISTQAGQYHSLKEVIGEQNLSTIITGLKLANTAFERPELEFITPDGNRLLIGFTVSEYRDPSDRQKGYILSLKDISYTKELQEEILRMDRLASLGVMASGIAHEIRNPLAGIKAIAQTFEEELSETDPKNEYVQRIIKQVNRLDDLLKSLFSYAKPQKPNRQFYHVREIIQDVLSLMKQKIHRQNIKLIQSFEKNLPQIYIDNSQIQQVLFNLVLNSIESIEKSGEIYISVILVNKDSEILQRKPFFKKITDNPFVEVRISDSGCGISPENLQQIFNPFFTTKNYGTGLGLSIVYQLVQENNGIIFFNSTLEKGTECYLFLPAFESVNKNIQAN